MENPIELGRIRTDNRKVKNYLNRVQPQEGSKPYVFFTDEYGELFLGTGSEQLWKEISESSFEDLKPLPKGKVGKNLIRWAGIVRELLKKGKSPAILKGETFKTFEKSQRHPQRNYQRSSGITLGDVVHIKST